ncbi:MAG: hypothetical protein J6I45_06420 [Clostridia bacterium]|nr:hypothetical protein [Clostridia bacterium]
MKRKLALLLAALMLASSFASCASDSGSDVKDSGNQAAATTAAETAGETKPVIQINPNLPAEDYEGYNFVFLSRWLNHLDWTPVWDPHDLDAEAENGEPVNDAVYKRNQMVEEKYNVVISENRLEHISQEWQKAFKQEIASGDNSFDVALPSIGEGSSNYAVAGNFVDLFTIDNLDLTQPWWDQNAVEDMTIRHKLFMVEGDLLTNYKDATAAMVFNKQLYADNGFEDIYALVENGNWTFDKLYEMMKGFGRDVDGDSDMDENDQYGLVCQVDSMPSLLNAAGETYALKDEDDMPYITINTESAVMKMEKIFDIMYSPDARNSHKIESTGNIYAIAEQAFKENRTLFMWIRMAVAGTLRDMEVDFGIIPVPKYDEKQENHYSTVNVNTGYGLCVPVTSKDLPRTGMILEALCSASYNNLTTAYYETNLQGKIVRDDESLAMLEIIFSNTLYDIGQVYNFGTMDSMFMNLSRTDNRNFTSTYAKNEKMILKAIEKLEKNLDKLDAQ